MIGKIIVATLILCWNMFVPFFIAILGLIGGQVGLVVASIFFCPLFLFILIEKLINIGEFQALEREARELMAECPNDLEIMNLYARCLVHRSIAESRLFL